MSEHGKPGGRWEYAYRPTPVQPHNATTVEVVLAVLVSVITIALVVALGVLFVLPLI